jgi:hypothetical protein
MATRGKLSITLLQPDRLNIRAITVFVIEAIVKTCWKHQEENPKRFSRHLKMVSKLVQAESNRADAKMDFYGLCPGSLLLAA